MVVPVIGDAGRTTVPATPVAAPVSMDAPSEAREGRPSDTVAVAGSTATVEAAARGQLMVTGAEKPGRA